MGTRDRAQVSSGGVGPPRGGGSGLSHGGWLTQQGLDDVVPGGLQRPGMTPCLGCPQGLAEWIRSATDRERMLSEGSGGGEARWQGGVANGEEGLAAAGRNQCLFPLRVCMCCYPCSDERNSNRY